MTAGLECDVGGRTRRGSACGVERHDFGMCAASPFVPAFAENTSLARNHTADTGIGLGRRKAAPRKFKRTRHCEMIEAVEVIDHGSNYLRSIGVTDSDGSSGS